jgi:hypothetical protein
MESCKIISQSRYLKLYRRRKDEKGNPEKLRKR